jgi:hypothetical protein
MSPEECLQIYGEAWFEEDDEKRVATLRRCCTEAIVFVDPQLGRLEGLDAVSKMIGGYHALMREGADPARVEPSTQRSRGRSDGAVTVDVVTGIDVEHGFFRYSFVWKLPDGSSMGGTDFGEFAPDGRMSLITVWPATDDFPLPARSS